MTGFSAVDYAVLLLYLVGITVFGTLFRRSQRTVKDYFLGAKNISWIVISLSIVATETLTLIGVPVLAYSTFARREHFAYRREGEHNGPEVLPYVEDHRCHTPMKMDQSFDCALEVRMRVFR